MKQTKEMFSAPCRNKTTSPMPNNYLL